MLPRGVTFTLAAQAGCAMTAAMPTAIAAASADLLPMRIPHVAFLARFGFEPGDSIAGFGAVSQR
jgi:hypothetical protein